MQSKQKKLSMKYILYLALLCFNLVGFAQEPLARFMNEAEKLIYPDYIADRKAQAQQTDPPNFEVRTPAEWEEHQAIFIAWDTPNFYTYPEILSQIVEHAQEEMKVYIITNNEGIVTNTLNANNIPLDNVEFLDFDFNSIWIRDYGPWTAYTDEVGDLNIIDWIYNRPRPQDDAVPAQIAKMMDLPFFETAGAPYDLVATGGNFMADGLGRGFSSDLIIEENPQITEGDIAYILENFMGIDDYVKMDILPYDGIHHIDMHMKLLDEETILMGEYPEGVADGPQIEANLQYVLDNYMSPFGTPYKVVRMPMPPDQYDDYPDNNGYYRTFTNSVFVNKTLIVPIYEEQYDTTALNIYRENLPGYNVVGIDCNEIIPASGAIHCITKMVGASEPLWIVHQELATQTNNDTYYPIQASIKHRSGIEAASVFYREKGQTDWQTADLADIGNDEFFVGISAISDTTNLEYYISATANSGKTITRPITAPEGYFNFDIYSSEPEFPTTSTQISDLAIEAIYPNPSKGISVIPVNLNGANEVKVEITDLFGRLVETIYNGTVSGNTKNFFVNTINYSSGVYLVNVYA